LLETVSLRLETAGLLDLVAALLLEAAAELSDSGPMLALSDELSSAEELTVFDDVLLSGDWSRVAGCGVPAWSVVANAVIVHTDTAKITVNKTMRNLLAFLFALIFMFKHILSNPNADCGLSIYRNK
jgi:hypothetical protein